MSLPLVFVVVVFLILIPVGLQLDANDRYPILIIA